MIVNIAEERRSSIEEVPKWLSYFGKETLELSKVYKHLSIHIDKEKVTIHPPNIEGIVYNGSSLFLKNHYFKLSHKAIKNSLYLEFIDFIISIFFVLNEKKIFGNSNDIYKENKIIDLIIASRIGLKIPDTLITGNKEKLEVFFEKYKLGIISKSLGGCIRFEANDELLWGKGTTLVTNEDIFETSDFFLPSLFQEKIEKEYEIRSFLFSNHFYSMAIFSQTDEQTSIDFRNYNRVKPNRMVPYKLPVKIENQLKQLADLRAMSTGSFDLIVTKKEKEFIFLEVNPYGQFGWLSKNCNYYLEKQIAEYFEN